MNTILTMTNAAISEIKKSEGTVAKIKEIEKIIPQEEEAKAIFFTVISDLISELTETTIIFVNNGIYNCVKSAIAFIDWRYVLKHLIGVEQKYQLDEDDSVYEEYTNLLTYEMAYWLNDDCSAMTSWEEFVDYWNGIEPQSEAPVLLKQWYVNYLFSSTDGIIKVKQLPLFQAAINCIDWQEIAKELIALRNTRS